MRRLLLLVSVGVFGVAVAVLPGLATATNPSVTASNSGYAPMQLATTPGGSIDFSNAGGTHDVHFTGSQPSSCSGSTANIGPSGSNSTAPSFSPSSWSGTCSFAQNGTYTFVCDYHHFTGTIYVNDAGTVPGTTMGTTGTTGTTTTTTPPTTTTGAPAPTPTTGGPLPSQLGSVAASGLTLPAVEHGGTVRGAVTIAAAGADFEADLLGNPSQLARSVVVGKRVKHGVKAGKLNFSVSLNRRGRAALKRRHLLRLKLVVKVTGSDGKATTLSRSVTVRA